MNRRTKLLYCFALAVACVIVGAGACFARHDHGGAKAKMEQFKQDLKDQKAAGLLPPEYEGVDLDHLEFGMQVPSNVMIRMDIARTLADLWYIFIPLVFVLCIGFAILLHLLLRALGGSS